MILSNGHSAPIAVQAFAETSPQFSEAFFAPDTGLQLAHNFATYGVMYKVQPHVFAVVNKIANLIARLGVTVWDTRDDKGDKRDYSSPYAKLMKKPCQTVDTFKFYHWISTTYEVYGETYLLKNRYPSDDGRPGKIASFIPMHPALTQIRRGENGVLHYQFMGQPNMWFPETEVVPFRSYNPHTTMRGLSCLEPLRQTLMNEDAARKATAAWWDNMGRPSMVLSTPKKLGDKGRANLRAGYRASIGGAENAGGIMILEDDVTATKMQLDAEEMQYVATRKINRGEVCTVYDINPEHIQIIDQLTSRPQQGKSGEVYKTSIDHRLKAIQSVFDFHVASEFNGDREFRFNVSQQLRGDVETLAPAAVQLVQSGIAKPKEAREWFDFDDAGSLADELYANQALQPLGALSASANAAAEQQNNPQNQPRELPTSPSATNRVPPSATGDLPKRVPALTDKAMKYKNDIFAGLGRGKEWDEVAAKLMDRNPGDRKDIHIACLHILTEAAS
jgi:HK97 family phage portal protein